MHAWNNTCIQIRAAIKFAKTIGAIIGFAAVGMPHKTIGRLSTFAGMQKV